MKTEELKTHPICVFSPTPGEGQKHTPNTIVRHHQTLCMATVQPMFPYILWGLINIWWLTKSMWPKDRKSRAKQSQVVCLQGLSYWNTADGCLTQGTLIPHRSGDWESKIKVSPCSFPSGAFFQACRWPPCCLPCGAQRDRETERDRVFFL